MDRAWVLRKGASNARMGAIRAKLGGEGVLGGCGRGGFMDKAGMVLVGARGLVRGDMGCSGVMVGFN